MPIKLTAIKTSYLWIPRDTASREILTFVKLLAGFCIRMNVTRTSAAASWANLISVVIFLRIV
jgi:hypothetical protein